MKNILPEEVTTRRTYTLDLKKLSELGVVGDIVDVKINRHCGPNSTVKTIEIITEK